MRLPLRVLFGRDQLRSRDSLPAPIGPALDASSLSQPLQNAKGDDNHGPSLPAPLLLLRRRAAARLAASPLAEDAPTATATYTLVPGTEASDVNTTGHSATSNLSSSDANGGLAPTVSGAVEGVIADGDSPFTTVAAPVAAGGVSRDDGWTEVEPSVSNPGGGSAIVSAPASANAHGMAGDESTGGADSFGGFAVSETAEEAAAAAAASEAEKAAAKAAAAREAAEAARVAAEAVHATELAEARERARKNHETFRLSQGRPEQSTSGAFSAAASTPSVPHADIGSQLRPCPERFAHVRIAMIIPWVGPLPIWSSYFFASAATGGHSMPYLGHSHVCLPPLCALVDLFLCHMHGFCVALAAAPIFDFLIFHEGQKAIQPPDAPHNVIFTDLGPGGLAQLFGMVCSARTATSTAFAPARIRLQFVRL